MCGSLPDHWNMSPMAAGLKPQDGSSPWRQLIPSESMHLVSDPRLLQKLQDLMNSSTRRPEGTACDCRGGRRFQLLGAYQVKNPYLWRRYQRCVQSMRERHEQYSIIPECPQLWHPLSDFARELRVGAGDLQETFLWHGTRSFNLARAMSMEGLDCRTARKKGNLYGRGTYFAMQSCKSAQYGVPSGSSASDLSPGIMLVARVALGDVAFASGAGQDKELQRASQQQPTETIFSC